MKKFLFEITRLTPYFYSLILLLLTFYSSIGRNLPQSNQTTMSIVFSVLAIFALIGTVGFLSNVEEKYEAQLIKIHN